MAIKYVDGDATEPIGDGKKLICHVVNDIGAWGAGFVIAVSNKWEEPEKQYKKWYKIGTMKLGEIQPVRVDKDIAVINMVGQKGIRTVDGEKPIRYNAIRSCLQKVCLLSKKYNATVHGPKFGAGLAGGDWDTIEKIINEELCSNDVNVTIYNFK